MNLLDSLSGLVSKGQSAITDTETKIDHIKLAVYILAAAEVVILALLIFRKR